MTIVGIKLMFVGSNPLHDLVFTLARAIWSCKNDADVFPVIIFFNFFLNEKMDHFVQFLHKLSSRGNWIIFEIFLTISRTLLIISVESLNKLLVVTSALESSCSLIVHFWSWSDTIQSQENHLARFEQVDNCVDIVKNLNPNLFKLLWHDLCFEYYWIILNLRKKFTFTHL